MDLSPPKIIITNLMDRAESYVYTSTLHHTFKIPSSHILYIGDKYELPVTTIHPSALLDGKKCTRTTTPYYQLLVTNSDLPWKTTGELCRVETKMADLINQLEKSQDRYEIIVDDPFYLQDESIYRWIDHKDQIRRIVQIDLEKEEALPWSPRFVDQLIYFWNSHRQPV